MGEEGSFSNRYLLALQHWHEVVGLSAHLLDLRGFLELRRPWGFSPDQKLEQGLHLGLVWAGKAKYLNQKGCLLLPTSGETGLQGWADPLCPSPPAHCP